MPFPHEAILGLDFFSALVDAFLQITRGLRPLVILGNASTCAEKKSNPRIASWGKDTLSFSILQMISIIRTCKSYSFLKNIFFVVTKRIILQLKKTVRILCFYSALEKSVSTFKLASNVYLLCNMSIVYLSTQVMFTTIFTSGSACPYVLCSSFFLSFLSRLAKTKPHPHSDRTSTGNFLLSGICMYT